MQANGHEGDRVHQLSTDEQIRTGVSLAVQQAKIEAYAMIKDWAQVDVICSAAPAPRVSGVLACSGC